MFQSTVLVLLALAAAREHGVGLSWIIEKAEVIILYE